MNLSALLSAWLTIGAITKLGNDWTRHHAALSVGARFLEPLALRLWAASYLAFLAYFVSKSRLALSNPSSENVTDFALLLGSEMYPF